ncbi:MAG: hypothetical protein KME21_06705 [Desmonostoc vinosum HA7617-LM4]|nr:hypothetical protein [Desmonostoc vinosum HA7617-LM4]
MLRREMYLLSLKHNLLLVETAKSSFIITDDMEAMRSLLHHPSLKWNTIVPTRYSRWNTNTGKYSYFIAVMPTAGCV